MLQPKYLRNLLIFVSISIVGQMIFLGMVFEFSEVGMGYTYNNFVISAAQIGSLFFAGIFYLNIEKIISNVGRKQGISIAYTIVTLLFLAYSFHFIKDHLIISTLLIGVIRCVSGNYICNFSMRKLFN
jgi:hypothetical protein